MKIEKYAIVDIETTGGLVNRDKITEIGIVIHDGQKIIEQFETLINPERSIPEYITTLTGITNEMVEEAPKFYEIAKTIVELTDGAIFVAHNVRFDYGFIREEFKRLGYTYSRKQLCTVRLSRKHLPQLRSHSLDSLIRHFNIGVKNRHRALDDALATVIILEEIFKMDHTGKSSQDLINMGIREARLPDNITLDRLHALPECTGVYYFHNKYGDIIYVGKSKNIKKRVMQHFAHITNKAAKLQAKVHDISFRETGSELIALLFENQEIKKHQPEVNRAQRRRSFPFVLYTCYDLNGYLNLYVGRRNKVKTENATIIKEYTDQNSARAHMEVLVRSFYLCQNLTDQPTGPGSCFYYKIELCNGACVSEESTDEYNLKVNEMMDSVMADLRGSMVIVDNGRSDDEQALIGIRNGRYYGFGYIGSDESLSNIQSVFDQIRPEKSSPESLRIIRHYLDNQKAKRVITF